MLQLTRLKNLPYGIILVLSLSWGCSPARYLPHSTPSLPFLETVAFGFIVEIAITAAILAAIQLKPSLFERMEPLSVSAVAAFASILIIDFFPNTPLVLQIALACVVITFIYLVMLRCMGIIARLPMAEALLSISLWLTFASPIHTIAEAFPFDAVGLMLPILAITILANTEKVLPNLIANELAGADAVNDGPERLSTKAADAQIMSGWTNLRKIDWLSCVPWKLLILDVLVVLYVYSIESVPKGSDSVVLHAGTLVAGVSILLFVITSGKLVRMIQLYNTSLVCAVVSVLCLAFYTLAPDYWLPHGLPLFFADITYMVFATFLFTVLCVVCTRSGINITALFGIALIAENVAGLCGVQMTTSLDTDRSLLLALVICSAIVITFVLLANENDYHTSWGIERPSKRASDPMSYYYSLSSVCASIAMQFSLSKRESDVLLLLSQKKSSPEIAEELFVSVPTIKTHTNNVYKKLGVHSRKELFELIDSVRVR